MTAWQERMVGAVAAVLLLGGCESYEPIPPTEPPALTVRQRQKAWQDQFKRRGLIIKSEVIDGRIPTKAAGQ
ncbi:MAG: hypothetical protein PHR30_18695 [Gallionellaceae bacterium]|nr:hypothetical protein [Gallionellaceae bacterium]